MFPGWETLQENQRNGLIPGPVGQSFRLELRGNFRQVLSGLSCKIRKASSADPALPCRTRKADGREYGKTDTSTPSIRTILTVARGIPRPISTSGQTGIQATWVLRCATTGEGIFEPHRTGAPSPSDRPARSNGPGMGNNNP